MSRPYTTKGLPAATEISMQTLPMAGLLVDVYGLAELPQSAPVTCLWLLHPRTWERGGMKDFASRATSAWHQNPGSSSRGLVTLVFDMPNHGSRLVSEQANQAWDAGNEQHAVDMMGLVKGAVGDMAALMDLVGGYLHRQVDAHVCLGWSLGGHSAWQAWAGEERIDAAVVIVGCPDYMSLMQSRAESTSLDFANASFIGSRYFPEDLIKTCTLNDPKAIFFGTSSPTPSPPYSFSQAEQRRISDILDRRAIKGKRLLLCSGADDTLVPYANGKPFIDALKHVQTWYGHGDDGFNVDDRLYEGVGHAFSKDMVQDAVEFLVAAVRRGPRGSKDKAKM